MSLFCSQLLLGANKQLTKLIYLQTRNVTMNYLLLSPSCELNEVNNLQHYADFKKLLRTRGVNYKDGYTCLKMPCKLCPNNDDKLAYVNKRNGCFMCPNCDVQFPLSDVLKAYSDRKHLIDSTLATTMVNKQTDPHLHHAGAGVPSYICDNLRINGLKIIDFELLEASFCKGQNSIILPLRNVNNGRVGELRHNVTTGEDECFQNSSLSGLLIHTPAKSESTKAILVSNILDFCSLLAQRLKSYSIVCLPYGLKTLPQECLPTLDQFDELILWFKYDLTSWGIAKTFANKLNEKRCLLIKPTANEPPPFEAQLKRFNLRQILTRATPLRHDSIITFKNLRDGILSELQNIEKVNGVKWKRFPILNKLLKGHRKGELTILTGPTGCGKTTFASEYSLDLALQGVSTLWGSFEIPNTRLAATLLRQFVGKPLEKHLSEFHQLATEFERFPIYFMTFHGQQPLKSVLEAIEHAHYVHDINHVIIDNLQFMMGLPGTNSRMDKFWEQDNIVAAFRSLATKRNVHVTLVMHPRKERDDDTLTTSSIFGSAKATQEADNVFIIQDKRLTNVHGKKYLQVAKNRYNGNLGIMALEFNKEALSYAHTGPKEKKEQNPWKSVKIDIK